MDAEAGDRTRSHLLRGAQDALVERHGPEALGTPLDELPLVAAAAYLADLSARVLTASVAVERGRKTSWTEIGDALGITRTAAHNRFATPITALHTLVGATEPRELMRELTTVWAHIEQLSQAQRASTAATSLSEDPAASEALAAAVTDDAEAVDVGGPEWTLALATTVVEEADRYAHPRSSILDRLRESWPTEGTDALCGRDFRRKRPLRLTREEWKSERREALEQLASRAQTRRRDEEQTSAAALLAEVVTFLAGPRRQVHDGTGERANPSEWPADFPAGFFAERLHLSVTQDDVPDRNRVDADPTLEAPTRTPDLEERVRALEQRLELLLLCTNAVRGQE
jgi:hypothetical protein